jgi:acetyl esterase/lipase
MEFTTVLIDYPLMPAYSMEQLVVPAAKPFIGCNKIFPVIMAIQEVYVSGHSAGGHLAAMMMVEMNSNLLIPQRHLRDQWIV